MTACASWCRPSARSRTNSSGRSESWSTCRARSCASGSSKSGPVALSKGETFTLDADKTPGNVVARAPAASRNLLGDRARPHAAAGRRQGAPDGDRGRRGQDRHARRGRRQSVGPQGREPAGHHDSVLRAGARRIAPISKPRSTPASTGSRCPSSSGRKTSRKPRRSRAAAPRDGQDREAAGGDPARRNPRHRGRADGGARRSRRRDAARAGAGHPEIHDAQRRAAPASRSWSRRRCWSR